MSVIDEIANERRQQIEVKGWSPQHDDSHDDGAMALAACCYASPELLYVKENYANQLTFRDCWPWDEKCDRRPHNGNVVLPNAIAPLHQRRRMLVKAAALLMAEIERLDRLSLKITPSLTSPVETS